MKIRFPDSIHDRKSFPKEIIEWSQVLNSMFSKLKLFLMITDKSLNVEFFIILKVGFIKFGKINLILYSSFEIVAFRLFVSF